jgi:predicted small lipoprotein YifL
MRALLALLSLSVIAGCGGNGGAPAAPPAPSGASTLAVSKEELGDDWPYNVDAGEIVCEGNSVYFRAAGRSYAVNGMARSWSAAAPTDDEIRLDDPAASGLKKSSSPIVERGLELCSW